MNFVDLRTLVPWRSRAASRKARIAAMNVSADPTLTHF